MKIVVILTTILFTIGLITSVLFLNKSKETLSPTGTTTPKPAKSTKSVIPKLKFPDKSIANGEVIVSVGTVVDVKKDTITIASDSARVTFTRQPSTTYAGIVARNKPGQPAFVGFVANENNTDSAVASEDVKVGNRIQVLFEPHVTGKIPKAKNITVTR